MRVLLCRVIPRKWHDTSPASHLDVNDDAADGLLLILYKVKVSVCPFVPSCACTTQRCCACGCTCACACTTQRQHQPSIENGIGVHSSESNIGSTNLIIPKCLWLLIPLICFTYHVQGCLETTAYVHNGSHCCCVTDLRLGCIDWIRGSIAGSIKQDRCQGS